MKSYRKIAIIVGILFIIGTAAGVASGIVTEPIFKHANILERIAAEETRWLMGAILVLVMGFPLAIMPAVIYPLLKKQNEALALGTIIFRGVLEAVCYIIYVFSMLMLLSISRQYAGADAISAANLAIMGELMLALGEWSELILAIVFSIGAIMYNFLLLKSRLVPRWLSGWGFYGAILYFAAPFISMLSPSHPPVSLDSVLGFLIGPLAIQEMVFAVWVIVKGFNPIEKTSLAKSS